MSEHLTPTNSNELNKQKIAVVGAGISGLVAGWELTKKGFDVTIFEATKTAGGRATTKIINSQAVDLGASFLMDSYDLIYAYLQEFGLLKKHDHAQYLNQSTIVLKNSKFYNYGLSGKYLNIFERLKFWFGIWKMAKETQKHKLNFFKPWKNESGLDNQSSEDYFKTIFSQEVIDYFLEPGIRSVQFHSSGFSSKETMLAFFKNGVPKNGLQYFTAMPNYVGKLSEVLASKMQVNYQSKVTKIQKTNDEKWSVQGIGEGFESVDGVFDQVVLNTYPDVIENIYPDVLPTQTEILQKATFSKSLTVVFEVPKNLFNGFYLALTPRRESPIVCSYTNEQIKGQNYVNGDKSHINVYLHEEAMEKLGILDYSDDQIFELVKNELFKVTPFLDHLNQADKKQIFENMLVVRWEKALSKSPVGWGETQRNFWKNGQGQNNVWFAGDWVGGNWLEGSTRTGQKIAEMIGG